MPPMKCPHCLENFHDQWASATLLMPTPSSGHAWLMDREGGWYADGTICPACNRAVIKLRLTTTGNTVIRQVRVYPKGVARSPLPTEVGEPYASDYVTRDPDLPQVAIGVDLR
jgi:hypothetical protein